MNSIESSQESTLYKISYTVAYSVLPRYAYNRLQKIEELYHKNSATAGAFFYALACQMQKVTPNRLDAESFSWHVGELDDQTDFYVMVHPTPHEIDFSHDAPEAPQHLLPAPYFSGIFRNRFTQQVHYYVLGQNPLGEGTTLRSVTIEPMANTNLGPGPEVDMDAFLASVAFRIES